MKKYIASSLVVLALTASAMSAATITAGVNDLILGFRAASGTGAASNLEVDLGNINSFTTLAAGGTIDFSSRLSATDLNATFGTFNRTTVTFGVAGTTGNSAGGPNGQVANTVWLTNTSNLLSSAVTKYGNTGAGLSIPVSALSTLYSSASLASLNGTTSTANSNYATVVAAATAGSWSAQGLTGSTIDFGTGNGITTTSATSGTKTLYLYQVQPNDVVSGTGVSYVGSFAFNTGTGGLVFTSAGLAAVPEPSTYAMIAGAFMLGFVALRRRFQK